jgi:hypothetical protein
MSFCTTVNCMDGRVQLPVIYYLKNRFQADYVDVISEPGPNLILAKHTVPILVKSIFSRLQVSVKKHKSKGIAIVGHFDCSGNPGSKEEQIQHTKTAIDLVKKTFNRIEIIGLWVDENWEVEELS